MENSDRYTDDLAPEKILKVAKMAARIASGPARSRVGVSFHFGIE
ncbi:MAG TPA: hypothetical protein VGW33_10805 [Terriglobia bacterium]|nr:hypothetical protein [Terriglobia bacterium]